MKEKRRNRNVTRMRPSQWRVILTSLVFGCAITSPLRGQVQDAQVQDAQVQDAQESLPLSDTSAKGSMEVYREFAKYPPESRPLNGSNWDLLHPWLTESSAMPMIPSQTLRQLESLQTQGLSEEAISQRLAIPSDLP